MQPIAFEFDVSEPQRKEGTGTLDLAYWVYKINARTNLSQYRNMATVTLRRYSDFHWMRQQLCLTFPGVVIPPIPEKDLIGTIQKMVTITNNNPLLQYRQRNLRRFLMRVGAHGALGASLLLQEFLEMSESEWNNRMKSAKKKGEGHSAAGMAMKKISSFTRGADPDPPTAGLPASVLEYVRQLEGVLTVLKDKLVIYSHRRKESTWITRDIGKTLLHLGELGVMYEDAAVSKALLEIGSNAMNIASVGNNQSDLELTQLAESVQYYLGICSAVRETVDVVIEAKTELSYLNSQLADVVAGRAKAEAAANHANVAKADAQIPNLTASRDAKKKDIQTLEATFVAELGRVHQEKLYDFQQLLQCFSDIQVEYADKMKKSWESLLPMVRAILHYTTPMAAAAAPNDSFGEAKNHYK